ncbi:hypothetical protein [Methanobrevibacter arboriphilus]|uniref:hypothetical protein n=1 Tax=Methanobrevibacter arboriphilus TaxID=39441 RepID=UPI001C82426D|nr:hypothetical protein [Methanobrevibacter arboriphilus]
MRNNGHHNPKKCQHIKTQTNAKNTKHMAQPIHQPTTTTKTNKKNCKKQNNNNTNTNTTKNKTTK